MARKKAEPSADHRKLAAELGIEIAERLLKRLPSMAEAIAEGSPSATFSATVKITDTDATVKCSGAIPLPVQDFKIRLARGQLSLFEGEEKPATPLPGPDTDPDPDLSGAVVGDPEDAKDDDPERDAAGPPKGASQVEAPTRGRKPRSNVKSVSRRKAGRSTTEVPALAGDGASEDDDGWGDDGAGDGYVPEPNAQLPDA